MSKNETAADKLFDTLDAILDRAKWGRRCVQLQYRGGDYILQTSIYDRRALRLAVETLAAHFVPGKYDVKLDEVAAIIDNLLEEYEEEADRIRLPERYKTGR